MSVWRKADVDEQKAALTRCVDYGRPAYGHEARAYPRRACFTFTVNDLEIYAGRNRRPPLLAHQHDSRTG